MELTDIEKKIINSLQRSFPIDKRPYKKLAEKLGINQDEFFANLRSLRDKGILKRIAPLIDNSRGGFDGNALVVWYVEENRCDEVGNELAGYRRISHCFNRVPRKDWPYNLYTMVHGRDRKKVKEFVERVAEDLFIKDYRILFTEEKLKKTSLKIEL